MVKLPDRQAEGDLAHALNQLYFYLVEVMYTMTCYLVVVFAGPAYLLI